MRLLISAYRSSGNPELLEAVAPDGAYTAMVVGPDASIEAYTRIARRLMTKLGYRQSDYALVDGTQSTDRQWTFVMDVPDFPLAVR